MHFVTVQTEEDQISEITQFFVENLRDSVSNSDSKSMKNFEDKLTNLNEQRDYEGMLEYLLEVREDSITLPTSHSKSEMTF